ncbi:discoidin domain-containing protein [Psychromonas sp.]|nr:discoidin domain-containing protein [Psychromonas sp.]
MKFSLILTALLATGLVGCASSEQPVSVEKTAKVEKKEKPVLIKPLGYVKRYGTSNETNTAPIPKPVAGFSTEDFGNTPYNVFDENFDTRWSSKGDKVWVVIDYGKPIEFNAVRLAFYKGDERITRFDLAVSETGQGWTNVITGGESSGLTAGFERFPFITVKAQYIKLIGYGNTNNVWTALSEFQAVNCKINVCPASELINANLVLEVK